jgi:hypothetical protein
MKLKNLLFCILALVLTSCSSLSYKRHAKDYDKILTKSRNVAILPPSIEVFTSDALGNKEKMYNYEIYLGDIMVERIKDILSSKGLRSVILYRKDIVDKKLYPDVTKIRDKYNQIREELYSTIAWETEKAHSVNVNVDSSAFVIGDKTGSDIILFVDYVRNIKTTGSRALAFFSDLFLNTSSSSDVDKAVIFIGLVDAKNGNLIWLNFFELQDSLLGSIFKTGEDKKIDTDHLNKVIQGVLKEIKISE